MSAEGLPRKMKVSEIEIHTSKRSIIVFFKLDLLMLSSNMTSFVANKQITSEATNDEA